jgi:hypothetical protein
VILFQHILIGDGHDFQEHRSFHCVGNDNATTPTFDRDSIPAGDRSTCGGEGWTTYSTLRQIHFGEVDEDKHNKYVSGEESDVTVNRAYGIYISSQGRMFVRSANIVQGGGSYKRPGNMNKSGIAAAQSVSPDGTVIKTRNFPVSHQNGSFTIDRWSVSPHSTAAYAALRSTSTKVSEPALLT